MPRQVFLLHCDSALVPMEERPYDSEALLQSLLARHPGLLAGEQMDASAPRRWLLVDREVEVPDEEDGSRRWSLDHLFLDQDGVPTLVEVKRSTDTRIRREVVGQMLDYAANAVAHWPIESLRARFETRCRREGSSAGEKLAEFLCEGEEPSDFWMRVKTNLQAGRIRLVFVADVIPSELRRIIEFLNAQMDPAEVLAVEIRQFVSGEMRTLVPSVIGLSPAAQARKGGAVGRQSATSAEFFEAAARNLGPGVSDIMHRIAALCRESGLDPYFSTGARAMSFLPSLGRQDRRLWPLSLRTDGTLVLQIRWLRESLPFSESASTNELQRRCLAIPGWSCPGDITGFPRFDLAEVVASGLPHRLTLVIS